MIAVDTTHPIILGVPWLMIVAGVCVTVLVVFTFAWAVGAAASKADNDAERDLARFKAEQDPDVIQLDDWRWPKR